MNDLLAELLNKGLISAEFVPDLLGIVDRDSSEANHAKTTLISIAKDPKWRIYRNALDWNIRCDWFFRISDVERGDYFYQQAKEHKKFDALYDLLRLGIPDSCRDIWEIIKYIPFLSDGYEGKEEYAHWLGTAQRVRQGECPDNLKFLLEKKHNDYASYWDATEATYLEPELFYLAIDYALSSKRAIKLPFGDARQLLRLGKTYKAVDISKRAIQQNAVSDEFLSELTHSSDSDAADDLAQLLWQEHWKNEYVVAELTPDVTAQWLIRVASRQEAEKYQTENRDYLIDVVENIFMPPNQQQATLIDAVIQYIPQLPISWDERKERLGLWAEAAAKNSSMFRWILTGWDGQEFLIWENLRNIRATMWETQQIPLYDEPLDLLFVLILDIWMDVYATVGEESSDEEKSSWITNVLSEVRDFFFSKQIPDERYFDQRDVTALDIKDIMKLVRLVSGDFIEANRAGKILERIVNHPNLVPDNVFTEFLKPNLDPNPDLADVYIAYLHASKYWKCSYRDLFMFELEDLEEQEWYLFQENYEDSKLIPSVISIFSEDNNLPVRTLVLSLQHLLPYHPDLGNQEIESVERLRYFASWMVQLNRHEFQPQYKKWFDLAKKFEKR